MNITYLIGNGFDIACGLKTRYSDFVQSYLAMDSDDKEIREFKVCIQQNLSTWADAEVAFGELTQKIGGVDHFIDCFNDFLDQMALYFSKQQSNFRLKKAERKNFIEGLKNFNNTLSEDSKKAIASCTSEMDCHNFNLNFLVFNYTEVFEKFLRTSIPKGTNEIEFHDQDGNACSCKFESLEYVHGKLRSLPLIFGVDSPEQISYPVHRNNKKIIQTLVKPIENEKTRSLVVERCKKLIKQSDMICVYGMSIGATDSMWWKLILTWLSENEKANLIIHYWEPKYKGNGAGKFIVATDICRNKFITNANSDIHSQATLLNRIHVVSNQSPFNITMQV